MDGRPRALLSAERVAARTRELGAQIAGDYAGKSLVLVPVLKGSFVFAADLARAIDAPLRIDFLGVLDARCRATRRRLRPRRAEPLRGRELLQGAPLEGRGRQGQRRPPEGGAAAGRPDPG